MAREYLSKYLPQFGIELERNSKENDIDFILHIPPAIQHSRAKIKVLYTMIEGDEVPHSWDKFLDEATHIITPTAFVQKAFENSGYDSVVIPFGYDPDVFKDSGIRNNDVFTFLHYEAFQDRKGWEDLMDAWLLSGLAEEENDCRLILKTIKPIDEVYKKIEDKFLAKNIRIVLGELPHHSLYDMLSEADCFVFPSRGEGFSVPPLEAMATGCPVILSKGHSHMDYYNEDYMYGVKCDIKIPARYQNWEDQGNFVRCDVNELAKVLRHVYDNRKEAMLKGKASVEYVKKYSYIESARKLAEYLCQLKDIQAQ